jgi:hypothetical protein
LEGLVTRSEKDERRINREKLVDAIQFLAETIPLQRSDYSATKHWCFHIRVKTNKFCDAEYIQISGTVYRNSERLYLLASPPAKTSERRDISR